VCKVTESQFDKAKQFEDYIVLTESSLDNGEVALALKSRKDWPRAFRHFPLYRE